MPPSAFTQPAIDIGDPASIGAAVKRLRQQADAFARFTQTALTPISVTIEQDIFAKMLDALKFYPRKRRKGDKLHWKSDRQRKKVMMMLRASGNLPYKRTGNLAKGWKNQVTVDPGKGTITITTLNDAMSTLGKAQPYQRFVTGDIGSGLKNYAAPIQPFHKDLGWQPAQPVIDLAHTQAGTRAFVLLDEAAAKVLQGGGH